MMNIRKIMEIDTKEEIDALVKGVCKNYVGVSPGRYARWEKSI